MDVDSPAPVEGEKKAKKEKKSRKSEVVSSTCFRSPALPFSLAFETDSLTLPFLFILFSFFAGGG